MAQGFEIKDSRAHGHVQAGALVRWSGSARPAGVIVSKPCRERELVLTMVAARMVCALTKLATTR